jgi:hypothetical protein
MFPFFIGLVGRYSFRPAAVDAEIPRCRQGGWSPTEPALAAGWLFNHLK